MELKVHLHHRQRRKKCTQNRFAAFLADKEVGKVSLEPNPI